MFQYRIEGDIDNALFWQQGSVFSPAPPCNESELSHAEAGGRLPRLRLLSPVHRGATPSAWIRPSVSRQHSLADFLRDNFSCLLLRRWTTRDCFSLLRAFILQIDPNFSIVISLSVSLCFDWVSISSVLNSFFLLNLNNLSILSAIFSRRIISLISRWQQWKVYARMGSIKDISSIIIVQECISRCDFVSLLMMLASQRWHTQSLESCPRSPAPASVLTPWAEAGGAGVSCHRVTQVSRSQRPGPPVLSGSLHWRRVS